MVLLDRLCGLESELAIRAEPGRFRGHAWRRIAFGQFVQQLSIFTPWASAYQAKEGIFLANGGAIWFEGERVASGSGLIELSTPECRGPRQLLTYQRAMEQLARTSADPVGLSLIKNDRDSRGAIYGGQENYEAETGSAFGLWIWRTGLVCLTPLILVCWLCVLVTLVLLLLYYIASGILIVITRIFSGYRSSRMASVFWGKDLATGISGGAIMPGWLEGILVRVSTVITAPLAWLLLCLARWTVFRKTRRRLTPFLVSRVILTGSGMVDQESHFYLADKAPAVNCVVGFSGFVGARPIYGMGHFFKSACVESFYNWREFVALFRPRQRLQIAVGDSNMAETAEFLKVGTTLLVLDAIEAGYMDQAPVLAHPIRALHAIAADATLQTRVRDVRGKYWRATDVQQWYLSACQRFVDEQAEEVSDEVIQVLTVWDNSLNALREYSENPKDNMALIGVLDWPTKRYLLDQVGSDVPWQVKKKIDLRYHELSEQGYYETIRQAGLVSHLVDETSIELAMRWPPSDTPAALRGRSIREFTGGDTRVSANWHDVIIRSGRTRRRIRLISSRTQSPRIRSKIRPRHSRD